MAAPFSKKNSENNSVKKFVESVYIPSPYSDEIMDWIHKVHSTVESKPRVALMYGPTDFGKSSSIKRYMKKYLQELSKDSAYKDHQPFAKATMTSESTKDELLTLLLASLGDPCPSEGKTFQKEERLIQLVEVLETTLMFIDDFGRLLRDSGVSFNKKICDYIQSLVEEKLKIPVLLVGVDECRYILDAKRELGRRTPFKFRLKAFSMDTTDNAKEFIRFLKKLEKFLPKKSITLSDVKMAKRLMIVSNGAPGPIKTLIEQACIFSDPKSSKLSLVDYERAFDQIEEASLAQEEKQNTLAASSKAQKGKKRKRPKAIEDTYSYKPAFNPFRSSISTKKLDAAIGALYE